MVALALAALGCGRAEWRAADAALNAAAEEARSQGYQPLAGPYNTFGDFAARGEVGWRVHLEAHQRYFIAAACTPGCDTLDFAVHEPHGSEVARDTSAGASPRLELEAPEEGDFHITFSYGACGDAAQRCRWIAQIYQRRSNP